MDKDKRGAATEPDEAASGARATLKAAAVYVPLSTLKPWAKNPRKNDGRPVAAVMASIEEFGFGNPVLVRLATNEIIAGHTRVKAAKQLGLIEVPVRFMDLTEAQAHKLALADNRIGELSDWDDEDLEEVLLSLQNEGEDLGAMGWTAEEMAKLLADPEPDVFVDELEVGDLIGAEFFLSVRGPVPSQPDVLARLRDALEDVNGVSVDLRVAGGS